MFYPQNLMQYGGAIRVTNEQEARNYPVAPGNSVLFIDGTQPFVYAKTMSLTPYEPPRFEKFRLVKEDEQGVTPAQTAKLIANNEAQTTALEQYLAPVPRPAWIVQNPNCCSANAGCGCGSF